MNGAIAGHAQKHVRMVVRVRFSVLSRWPGRSGTESPSGKKPAYNAAVASKVRLRLRSPPWRVGTEIEWCLRTVTLLRTMELNSITRSN